MNREVNALPYKADPERYGKPEFWTEIDQNGGDCEDFAIGKLRRLVGLGWPVERLRLALCRVETGELHCVLSVESPVGELVLDNRNGSLNTADELKAAGYTPETIQEVGGSQQWRVWL